MRLCNWPRCLSVDLLRVMACRFLCANNPCVSVCVLVCVCQAQFSHIPGPLRTQWQRPVEPPPRADSSCPVCAVEPLCPPPPLPSACQSTHTGMSTGEHSQQWPRHLWNCTCHLCHCIFAPFCNFVLACFCPCSIYLLLCIIKTKANSLYVETYFAIGLFLVLTTV